MKLDPFLNRFSFVSLKQYVKRIAVTPIMSNESLPIECRKKNTYKFPSRIHLYKNTEKYLK